VNISKVTTKGMPKTQYNPAKTHSVTTNNKLPVKSTPNSSIDLVDDAGNVVRRRYFDGNGNVIKDVDFTNHGNPKFHPEVPHEHLWKWKDGKPIRD